MNKYLPLGWLAYHVGVCVCVHACSSRGSSMAPVCVVPSVVFSQRNTHHGVSTRKTIHRHETTISQDTSESTLYFQHTLRKVVVFWHIYNLKDENRPNVWKSNLRVGLRNRSFPSQVRRSLVLQVCLWSRFDLKDDHHDQDDLTASEPAVVTHWCTQLLKIFRIPTLHFKWSIKLMTSQKIAQ